MRKFKKQILLMFIMLGGILTIATAAPTVSIYPSPATINSGQQTIIYWSGSGANVCSMFKNGTQFYTGTQFFSSAFYSGALTTNTIYKILCTAPDGSTAQKETTVTVLGETTSPTVGNIPDPTVNIYSSPSTINSGQQSIIYWSGSGAASCSLFRNGVQFYTGSQAFSSAFYSGALTSNTTFKITCVNQVGVSTSKEATVNVVVPQPVSPTLSMYASPATVNVGGQTAVYWSASGANSCSLLKDGTQFYTGTQFFASAFWSGPLQSDTVYKLSCTSSTGGLANLEYTVRVLGGTTTATVTKQLATTTLENTAITISGTSHAAYPSPVGLLAFVSNGATVTAYKADGSVFWTRALGFTVNNVSGGMDLQGDGYRDLVVAGHNVGSDTYMCGSTAVNYSTLTIVDGKTGVLLTSSSGPNCIAETVANNSTFPAQRYLQYHGGSILFGAGANVFLARTYETMGWAVKYANSLLNMNGTALFPSTHSYESAYPHATVMYNGLKFVPQSHTANGLIIEINNVPHVVYFTSGKVLVYNMGGNAITPLPLLYDNNFVSHSSTSDSYNDEGSAACFDGCRSYGLVRRLAEFTTNPNLILLLSGTNSFSLSEDSKTGTKSYDIWGGIVRKVNMYNPLTNIVTLMRYYSYAHDAGTLHQYGGRLTYPSDPIVQASGKTYALYNVYNQVDSRSDATVDDRWFVSINEVLSDGQLSESKLYNYYLWDIVKGVDGKKYLLMSPTQGYFPKKMTDGKPVVQVIEMTGQSSFVVRAEYSGVPKGLLSIKNDKTSDSSGYLFRQSVLNGVPEVMSSVGY